MSNLDILEEVLRLQPQERYLVVETLLKSLDKPDEEIDTVWADEAQKRLEDYRKNKIDTIPFDTVFNT